MALRNATVLVLGNAWVWARLPAPGATGSALGAGGGGGAGSGGGPFTSPAGSPALAGGDEAGPLTGMVALTGRAVVPAPPEQPDTTMQAASSVHPASGTTIAPARRRGLRAGASRHLVKHEVGCIPARCLLHFQIVDAGPGGRTGPYRGPPGAVGGTLAGLVFASVRALERGYVELRHAEHRRRDCPHLLLVRVGDHVEEHGGHDLPAEAVLVLHPAAGDLLAAVAEAVPVVVNLGLIRAFDHERHRG